HLLDEVVGDFVGAVPIDIDPMHFPRRGAVHVVDVVADPERAGAVAGDAAGEVLRIAGAGRGGDLVVDDAPVVPGYLLVDDPGSAARLDAQIRDRDVTAARVGGGIHSGDGSRGTTGVGLVDVDVLVGIGDERERSAPRGAGRGCAVMIDEAQEVAAVHI